jgi:hypothetical protein
MHWSPPVLGLAERAVHTANFGGQSGAMVKRHVSADLTLARPPWISPSPGCVRAMV